MHVRKKGELVWPRFKQPSMRPHGPQLARNLAIHMQATAFFAKCAHRTVTVAGKCGLSLLPSSRKILSVSEHYLDLLIILQPIRSTGNLATLGIIVCLCQLRYKAGGVVYIQSFYSTTPSSKSFLSRNGMSPRSNHRGVSIMCGRGLEAVKKKPKYEALWQCDWCLIGSALSMWIDHCPECHRARTSDCRIEFVEPKDSVCEKSYLDQCQHDENRHSCKKCNRPVLASILVPSVSFPDDSISEQLKLENVLEFNNSNSSQIFAGLRVVPELVYAKPIPVQCTAAPQPEMYSHLLHIP